MPIDNVLPSPPSGQSMKITPQTINGVLGPANMTKQRALVMKGLSSLTYEHIYLFGQRDPLYEPLHERLKVRSVDILLLRSVMSHILVNQQERYILIMEMREKWPFDVIQCLRKNTEALRANCTIFIIGSSSHMEDVARLIDTWWLIGYQKWWDEALRYSSTGLTFHKRIIRALKSGHCHGMMITEDNAAPFTLDEKRGYLWVLPLFLMGGIALFCLLSR